jgi:hypothetical protein
MAAWPVKKRERLRHWRGDGLVGMEKRCLDTKLEGKRKVNTRCETSPEVIAVQKIYLRCTAGCRRGRCAGHL